MLKLLLVLLSANWLVLGEFTTELPTDDDQTTLAPAENLVEKPSNGTANRFTLPEDFYIKAYGYLKASKAFRHFSYQDAKEFVEDLATWKTPTTLERDFPYYLAGYDYDDRPIWIVEFGKYDPRNYLEQGPEGEALLEKFTLQAAIRCLQSTQAKETAEKEVRDVVFIVDCEGLDLSIVTHPPSVAFGLKIGHAYRDVVDKALATIIVLNANYATRIAIEIARPVAGRIMEKLDVFGPIKSKYRAVLRRRFPPKSIPTWYGGDEGFKPIQVYG